MKKNVASQVIGVQMITAADGTAFTGTVSCYITKDAGSQTASTNSPVSEGNGLHTVALEQAETNADHIAFTFTGSGAIPATVQVYTTFPQTGDNFARLGSPSAASVSLDILALNSIDAAIKAKTDSLTFTVAGLIDSNMLRINNNALTSIDTTLAPRFDAIQSVDNAINSKVDDLDTEIDNILTNMATLANQAIELAALVTIDNVVDAISIKVNSVSVTADAIKAKTDLLNSSIAGSIDANIKAINDIGDAAVALQLAINTDFNTIAATIDDSALATLANQVIEINALTTIDTNVDSLISGVNVSTIEASAITSIDTELSLQHGGGSWDAVGSGAVTSISIDALTSIDAALEPRFTDIQDQVNLIFASVTSIYAAIPSDLAPLLRFIKDVVSAGMHTGINKFVDQAIGDDSNTGNDWVNAYETIGKAIDEIEAEGGGGFIFVKNGTYAEEFVVHKYICIVGIKDADSYVEISGLATSAAPTVTMEHNSGMTGVRLGKQDDTGASGCVLLMQSGSRFWDSSIGDVAVDDLTDAIRFDTNCVEVECKDNTLDGCSKVLSAFGGTAENSDIKGNKTTSFKDDLITLAGADNDITENRFLGIATGKYGVAAAAAITNSNISNNLWSGTGSFIPTSNALSNCNTKNNEQWATDDILSESHGGGSWDAIGSGNVTSISIDALISIDTAISAHVLAELAGDAGATPTRDQAAMLNYMRLRDKFTQEDPTGVNKYAYVHNGAGTAIIKEKVTDNGTTFVKDKMENA